MPCANKKGTDQPPSMHFTLNPTALCYMYSAGEEKSPLFIFLHDQLPLFPGETGRNSGKFLQVSPGNPIFAPGNTCISP